MIQQSWKVVINSIPHKQYKTSSSKDFKKHGQTPCVFTSSTQLLPPRIIPNLVKPTIAIFLYGLKTESNNKPIFFHAVSFYVKQLITFDHYRLLRLLIMFVAHLPNSWLFNPKFVLAFRTDKDGATCSKSDIVTNCVRAFIFLSFIYIIFHLFL